MYGAFEVVSRDGPVTRGEQLADLASISRLFIVLAHCAQYDKLAVIYRNQLQPFVVWLDVNVGPDIHATSHNALSTMQVSEADVKRSQLAQIMARPFTDFMQATNWEDFGHALPGQPRPNLEANLVGEPMVM